MRKCLMLVTLLPSLALGAATEELVAKLQGLQSLRGGFEQTVLDQDGRRAQEAAGRMEVARGNRFYWKTERPYEQLAVSDGETVWVYDADLEQVVVRPLNDNLSETPALLFGGNPSAVGDAFRVEEKDRNGDNITYRLKPRSSDPLFETLDVTFDGQRPVSMRLEDALGQKTVIDFRDLTLNQAPQAGRFDFQPPEGTDVIRQQ